MLEDEKDALTMLTRRHFVIGLFAGVALARPAHAQDFAVEIESQLRRRGYRIEAVGRTLLGRVRILAENSEGQREIILNPRTGEILRDLWIARGKSGPSTLLEGNGGRDNSGKGGGDDDDDDDDDVDDDNSGSGGNSGHGGGGSNSGGSEDD
jgi:hypothetical protein